MNVQQLIRELQRCPLDAEVAFFVDMFDQRVIDDIRIGAADARVLLGTFLPPEPFGDDEPASDEDVGVDVSSFP